MPDNEQELLSKWFRQLESEGALVTPVLKEMLGRFLAKLKAVGCKLPEECAECKNLRKFLKDNNASKVIEALGYVKWAREKVARWLCSQYDTIEEFDRLGEHDQDDWLSVADQLKEILTGGE